MMTETCPHCPEELLLSASGVTWACPWHGPIRDYEPEETYSCGSNYCDDPACVHEHPEVL